MAVSWSLSAIVIQAMTFENPQELPDDPGILLQGPINCIRNLPVRIGFILSWATSGEGV